MKGDYLFETWKDIKFDDKISEKEIFKISTYGRVKSFKVDKEKGKLIKLYKIGGYPRISVMQKTGKETGRYIHKLVAETFIPKDSEDQEFVIHLDYNKENNKIFNLAWANKKQKEDHQFRNTKSTIHRKKSRIIKLDEGKVRLIKKLINDPNRKTRMKIIAKRFGVSEMQLYRIKSGENWGHVKVD